MIAYAHCIEPSLLRVTDAGDQSTGAGRNPLQDSCGIDSSMARHLASTVVMTAVIAKVKGKRSFALCH